MIDWTNLGTTREELLAIHAIAGRAVKEKITGRDFLSIAMDIELAHTDHPLELSALLEAPDNDFWHDIMGIIRNLNRNTGKIENCFCPRYALKINKTKEQEDIIRAMNKKMDEVHDAKKCGLPYLKHEIELQELEARLVELGGKRFAEPR